MDDSPEALAAKRGEPVPGDCWLDVVRMYPPAEWLKASGMVLVDVFEDQNPPIKSIPANELLIMQAWNARVLEDNERLRADIAAPRRTAVKPRLRPDLRFRELLQLWNKENAPRPQSYVKVERATEDLIDYLGDIPVESFTSDMLMDYRDEAKNLPATMPRADRALPFNERLARHAHSGTPRVSPPTLKKRVGSIQSLLSFAHQQRWISQNAGTGVKITGFSRVARGRRSFMPGELAQLFASDLFLRPDRLLDRRTDVSDVTLYWLFLLGLTSGARLEEVGQARVQDVKADGGILYIDIDDLMDAEADPNLPEKSVKTTGSRRIIPIHEHVLTLGFERYVSALKDAVHETRSVSGTDRFGHSEATDGDGCIVVPDFLSDLADGLSRALRQIMRQRGHALNLADRHDRENRGQLQPRHRHGGGRARSRRIAKRGTVPQRQSVLTGQKKHVQYRITAPQPDQPVRDLVDGEGEALAETRCYRFTIKITSLRSRVRHQPHAALQPCRQHGKAARQLFDHPAAYPAIARTQPGELQHGGPLQQRMANTARHRKPARFHGRHFHPRDQSLCQFLRIREARSKS
ncbi:MAG: hypothetical protein PGN16_02190 [Sphingomonas phyllosphaerae]|uniref:hypothetical protein n=1 Tax=Sphingomonas phyllosphaerae TaxID=257003 RepID=UPI002FF865F4